MKGCHWAALTLGTFSSSMDWGRTSALCRVPQDWPQAAQPVAELASIQLKQGVQFRLLGYQQCHAMPARLLFQC